MRKGYDGKKGGKEQEKIEENSGLMATNCNTDRSCPLFYICPPDNCKHMFKGVPCTLLTGGKCPGNIRQ